MFSLLIVLNWCANWDKEEDRKRVSLLRHVTVALQMYFHDKWEFPEGNNTNDLEHNFKEYFSNMPKDKLNNNWFFYMPLKNDWLENAWALIWMKVSYAQACDVNIYSKEKLIEFIENNNYDYDKITKHIEEYIDKIKKDNIKFNNWCYFITTIKGMSS